MSIRTNVLKRFQVIGLAITVLAVTACRSSTQPAESPAMRAESPAAGEAQTGVTADSPPETLSDVSITQAIERELLMDRAVDIDNIDVVTSQGIVELTGTVDNILAKERAARIAELVKGVRAVSNQIAVVPPAERAEDAIRNEVRNALFYDPATESYELDVDVEGNAVTLTGTVQSWPARQLAEHVAKGVRGVAEVRNRIEVEHESERSDVEIENEIVQRMRWDVLVDAGLIDVEVEGGAVTLSGTVGSAAERSRAYLDAWVAGVKSVDHGELEVKWWARDPDLRDDQYVVKSDDAVKQAILDAARYDPRVSPFAIEPVVTAGIVTLRGTVSNVKARQAAEQLARNTLGVMDVKNELEVQAQQPVPDDMLRTQVSRALARNAVTEDHDIQVQASKGTITLRGTVDSYFEKLETENAAEGVRGVVAVRNQLEVADTPHAFIFEPYLYPYDALPPEAQSEYVPRTPTKSDAEIREDIQNELLWSPYVDVDEVTVSVINGRATLTGTVDSWRESRAATANAFQGGAIAVVNRLDVKQN